MAANTGANLKGLRDRALLLIGFAGALRRSELVALNIEDIETLTPRLDGGRSPEWPAAADASAGDGRVLDCVASARCTGADR